MAFAFFAEPLRELGRTEAEFIAGTGLSLEVLRDPTERVDWEDWATLCDRFADWVGTEAELERWGRSAATSGLVTPIRNVAGALVSSHQVYDAAVRWFAPIVYRSHRFRMERAGPRRVVITIELLPGFRGCRPWFVMALGGLAAAPSVIGAAEARAHGELTPERGIYTIDLPPELPLRHRLSRRLRRFASVRAALDELAILEREVSGAQRAIADSATELAAALDRLPNGVALLRGERILVANRALGEFVGVPPSELIGRSLAAALSPRAPGAFAELFTEGRAATAPVLVTVEGRDAPPRVLECLPPFPLAHQGTPARLFVLRDVTEQLATEARLRASEATNRALVEALPHALIRVRRSGEVVQAVAGRAILPDVPAASLVGQRVQDLAIPGLTPEAVAAGRAVTAVVLDDGVPRTFELELGAAETRSVFECDISRFDREEALVVVRDVTERRRLTAQIAATDRLASLGTLAAGVAHEINNPLTYVLANLGDLVVRFRSGEALDERELPLLTALAEEALSGAERVTHIVRDLRPFARGPADDTTTLVNVEQVLDAMTSIARNEIRHRAALVKDYGGVPAVEGSEARLGQVFLNLLVNAAQAIPVGAADRHTITVRTSAAGGEVRVDVEDTGGGMPPEVVSRIFDPFFTTKPRGEGTGLGLTICRDIVQRLGGRVEAESEVGRGTRFSVWLPAGAPRVERGPQPARPASAPPQVARILIVDDEPPVGRALARLLRAHDVRVTRSGQEALDVLATDRAWDVVFCDLMMPILSGIDVHAEVRERYPEVLPAFVFMTGGAFTDGARALVAQSDAPLIEKPFDPAAVRDVIRGRLRARSR